jgi:phage-related protein
MPVAGKKSIADTYVSILPETSRVASEIAKSFREVDTQARQAGRRWRDEMTRELDDVRVGLSVDGAQARADAERLKAHIERMRPTIHVETDVDHDRLKRSLSTSITSALASLTPIAGGSGVQAGQAFSQGFSGAASSGGGAGSIAGLGAGILGLAGIASSTAGAIGLIPAAATGAVAAIGTLKLAFDGFGDAMKDIKDPEKFAEDLKQLAPGAQQAATAIQGLMPLIDQLKFTVQDAFFTPFVDSIKPLAETYMPMLRGGLSQFASVMGGAVNGLAQFMQTPEMLGLAGEMTNNLVSAFSTFSGVLNPIVGAMTQIGAVGSSFMPQLAQAAVDAANGFSQMVSQAAASGQMGSWIQTGIDSLGQIFTLATNLAPLLGSLAPLGTALLPVINQLVVALTPGITALGGALGQLITAASPLLVYIGDVASTILTALAPAFQTWMNALGPVVQEFTNAMYPIMQQMAPVLQQVAQLIADGIAQNAAALTPIVMDLVKALGDWMISLTPMLPALTDLAMSVLPALSQTLTTTVLPILTTVIQWMTDWANVVIPPLAAVIGGMADSFRIAFETVKSVVKSAWDYIGPIFDGIKNSISWIIDGLAKLPGFGGGSPAARTYNGGAGTFGPPPAVAAAPSATIPSGMYRTRDGQLRAKPGAGPAPAPAYTPTSTVPPPPVSSYVAPPPTSGSAKKGGGSSAAADVAENVIITPENIQAAINQAQSVSGNPYGYGGVGPGSGEGLYDCSGFMSDLYAILTGKPYQGSERYFTTESDFGQLGFVEGFDPNSPFNIGVHNGGGGKSSHMAGTLAGVNVESGPNGTVFGGPAAGAADSQFEKQYHLPASSVLGGYDGSPALAGLPDNGALPKQLRDARQRVQDRQFDIDQAQRRLDELNSKDPSKVSAAQRAEAEHKLARAKREHADAIDDLAKAQEKYNAKQKNGKGNSDFSNLGQDLLGGMLQVFGFDGSLFGDPSQFGITKLISGMANWATQPVDGTGTGGGTGGGGGLLSFIPQAFGDLKLGGQKDGPVPFMGGMPGYDQGGSLPAGAQFAAQQGIHGVASAMGATPGPGNGNHYGDVININGGGNSQQMADTMRNEYTLPRARQAVR